MDGIEIRNLQLSDCKAVEELLVKAFEHLNPAGIVEREVALAGNTSWVALVDGFPCGMACGICYDHIAYIGPMAVAPEFQGRGIGAQLFERLLNSLEERGCSTMMLDATDAGEPLYRKFGFVEWTRTFDMDRPAGSGLAPESLKGELGVALQLDHRIFTADREATFRRLFEQEGARLFSNSSGYLVAQKKNIGPFAAINAGAATALLDEALAAGAVASRALAPVENRDARPLLESRGFTVRREVKHMRRGRAVAMRRDLMYGLASFALG